MSDVLTNRDLNRALLERQLLLRRARMSVFGPASIAAWSAWSRLTGLREASRLVVRVVTKLDRS